MPQLHSIDSTKHLKVAAPLRLRPTRPVSSERPRSGMRPAGVRLWRTNTSGRAAGFSLLELMVGMAILAAISAGAFTMIDQFQRRYTVELEVSSLTSAGQRVMTRMEHELRMAGYPAKGMYGANATGVMYDGSADNLVSQGFTYNTSRGPAVTATPQSLYFEAALNDRGQSTLGTTDPTVGIVGYYLTGTPPQQTLVRSYAVKQSNGMPGVTTTRNLVGHVSSLTFTYFDVTGTPFTPTLGSAAACEPTGSAAPASCVAQVRVNLVLQTAAVSLKTHRPIQLAFSGGVHVRN